LELEYYVQHLGHTISSLMPYTDTTNPLYVMINNTALKGQTYHNLTAYISRTMLRDMNVYFDASFTTYFNGTGTKTLYNQKTGVSTYMYDNVNGDWNTKLKVGLSSSLDEKKRWKIDSRIELEYKHSVDFDILYSDGSAADLEYMMTHENLSRVNTARPGTYAKLSYRNGNFSWSVNGKINGIFSNGDRENFQNVNAADYQYGATLQYNILPWKISIGTDITMFSRRGYNMSEMNTDDLVWNAQISRSFFGGKLIAKIRAFDILRRVSNKKFSIDAQSRTETWYNSIPSYYMFTLACQLSKNPKKK